MCPAVEPTTVRSVLTACPAERDRSRLSWFRCPPAVSMAPVSMFRPAAMTCSSRTASGAPATSSPLWWRSRPTSRSCRRFPRSPARERATGSLWSMRLAAAVRSNCFRPSSSRACLTPCSTSAPTASTSWWGTRSDALTVSWWAFPSPSRWPSRSCPRSSRIVAETAPEASRCPLKAAPGP